MKFNISIILVVAAIVASSANNSFAQDYDYYLIFGNRDAATIDVRLGQEISIPAWGATDPANYWDSINFVHMPLATDDSIVMERLGGYFPDTLLGRWDEIYFLESMPDGIQSGYTNQSLLGFAYLYDPIDNENFFITFGDTVLMCYYTMRLTSNPKYADSTVTPFTSGIDPDNGGPLWGIGITAYVPTTTFSSLHFVVCETEPGDANADWLFNGLDAAFCVNYLKGIGPEPPCKRDCPPYGDVYYRADSNGNCVFNGLDITYTINYLKGTGPEPVACPACA